MNSLDRKWDWNESFPEYLLSRLGINGEGSIMCAGVANTKVPMASE